MASAEQASTLLLASGAAAPITPTHKVAGRTALDGGFYDNAPLPKTQPASGNTLVLLTRHKPDWPQLFELDGRVYLQPKSKVTVTNMDCTDPVGVQRTFDQGLMEAAELLG
jgi:predicted acylesterase/phospholipase RssA